VREQEALDGQAAAQAQPHRQRAERQRRDQRRVARAALVAQHLVRGGSAHFDARKARPQVIRQLALHLHGQRRHIGMLLAQRRGDGSRAGAELDQALRASRGPRHRIGEMARRGPDGADGAGLRDGGADEGGTALVHGALLL
jgi:hypothetical protein